MSVLRNAAAAVAALGAALCAAGCAAGGGAAWTGPTGRLDGGRYTGAAEGLETPEFEIAAPGAPWSVERQLRRETGAADRPWMYSSPTELRCLRRGADGSVAAELWVDAVRPKLESPGMTLESFVDEAARQGRLKIVSRRPWRAEGRDGLRVVVEGFAPPARMELAYVGDPNGLLVIVGLAAPPENFEESRQAFEDFLGSLRVIR